MRKSGQSVICAFAVLLFLCSDLHAQPPSGLPPGLTKKLAEQMQRDWKDRPEWADMAIEILSDPSAGMGQGKGWFRGSQLRYSWKWVEDNFDVNTDQRVVPEETAIFFEGGQFPLVDRDRSGFLSKEDFDWSAGSPVFSERDTAADIFYRLDKDSNGRITKDELSKFFDERAVDVDFLTTEDLRDGLGLRNKKAVQPEAPPQKTQGSQTGPPEFMRLRMLSQLLDRQMGSLTDGPDVEDDAPELDLPIMKLQDDKLTFELSNDRIKLSDHVGKRPVVLVFGSFT